MTCCAGCDGCDRPDVVMLISRCCQMDAEAAVDLLDRVGLLGSWLDALLLVGFGLQGRAANGLPISPGRDAATPVASCWDAVDRRWVRCFDDFRWAMAGDGLGRGCCRSDGPCLLWVVGRLLTVAGWVAYCYRRICWVFFPDLLGCHGDRRCCL
ncbi:hypothetical protein ACLOJK_041719 [Asimina triloba]